MVFRRPLREDVECSLAIEVGNKAKGKVQKTKGKAGNRTRGVVDGTLPGVGIQTFSIADRGSGRRVHSLWRPSMTTARFFLALLCCGISLSGANRDLLTQPWSARWISVPGTSPFDYGVYHFRRTFELSVKPANFLVHVTADNRYQLFVNGERVVSGPARGDLFHWRYESVDIAAQLRAGKNVLAAVVWNDGEHSAVAQISYRTGFLLQGDTEAERVVDTGNEWRSIVDKAYQPIPVTFQQVNGYYAGPPGERVDGAQYPWGWEQPGYDDSSWVNAEAGSPGSPRDTVDGPNRWMLVPRPIPLMEQKPIRFGRVRKAAAVTPRGSFPKQPAAFQVPANSEAEILLDQDHLTTAYPEFVVSGGRGAEISVRYAEALWLPDGSGKGNRNEIEGKVFKGYQDIFLADGGERRMFRPLFWRTYRYVELKIKTAEAPLTMEDVRGTYTGYPFERKAVFESDSRELPEILDVGWRTARLCAHETYMDCPYYEQLQYAGDTRIQCLVSLFNSGDARLMRNAIEQLNSSRTAEGLTYSRAPSELQQYIPPFSLWWIGILHDYWMYVEDAPLVREMLPGVRAVLSFFERHQQPNGSLARLPWWNYLDWVENWPRGLPPQGPDGSSAAYDLQLLLAYQWADEMESALGHSEFAQVDRAAAQRLRSAVRSNYWKQQRGLFSDTAEGEKFSQQANSLAVLAGVTEGAEARHVIEKTLAEPGLAPASIYFRYYLHRAAVKAGLGDRYLEFLDIWRQALAQGSTTWPERVGFRVRSECHAWGSSPNIEVFRTILGLEPVAPGFARVAIRPHLGQLSRASGSIPHPKGELKVSLRREGAQAVAEIDLPAGVTGNLYWQGRQDALPTGHSRFTY
jgi:hypothetical protein